MTPELEIRVSLTLAALRLQREAGLIGEREQVSIKSMSRLSHEIGEPVSERTFRRLERTGLHRARLAALALQSLSQH
jgi:hypothetical protein